MQLHNRVILELFTSHSFLNHHLQDSAEGVVPVLDLNNLLFLICADSFYLTSIVFLSLM